MSLKHAILGFLTLHPMSGYELKTQYFDGSVAHFWSADQAQIYRTLDKLEQDGLVESEVVVQTIRPNRKPYTITDAGREALAAWLVESRDIGVLRMPFLVQLYFGRNIPRDQLLTVLQDQLRQHQEQLAAYRAIELPASDDPIMLEQLQFGGFTLDFGLRFEQMQIDWLEATIAVLETTS